MKMFLALVLSTACISAMAEEMTTDVTEQIPVEQYTYSKHLDIAKVLSTSAIPNVCGVVPARMTYEDSTGKKHILEYQVMGNGCSNG
ncbi:hypothetical protein D3C76_331350 [compost metagenome]